MPEQNSLGLTNPSDNVGWRSGNQSVATFLGLIGHQCRAWCTERGDPGLQLGRIRDLPAFSYRWPRQRAGSPALRLVDPSVARPHGPAAIAYGVNVHAAVRVHGNDRAQLERLCRYLGRPPIAEERLTRREDGRLCYELKRVWKDGTRAVLLSPLDLCARVCALIPRPGFNMVRYYGCLSSHSALRREVVPKAPPALANLLLGDDDAQLELGFGEGDDDNDAPRATRRRPWAWLLRHVWEADVSTCPRCGGPMMWLEVATEPDAIRRVLAELEGADSDDGFAERRTASRSFRSPPPERLGLGFG
jgi:hypothetical protein